MVSNGDKIRLVVPVFGHEAGEICTVVEVDTSLDQIAYKFDSNHNYGVMNSEALNKYFVECKEEEEEQEQSESLHFVSHIANTMTANVDEDRIDWLMENAEIEAQTIFDKCTIVSCKLPNGFVIVESSACVSPENYDEEVGIDICLEKIANKIWELEGYLLQNQLYEEGYEDDFFEEPDCDGCEDYDCEYNPNNSNN